MAHLHIYPVHKYSEYLLMVSERKVWLDDRSGLLGEHLKGLREFYDPIILHTDNITDRFNNHVDSVNSAKERDW